MSRNRIKGKKVNLGPTLTEVPPREMVDIQKEYSELCVKAGQIQYQIAVLETELMNINDRLLVVNREASKRSELDRENKQNEEQKPNE